MDKFVNLEKKYVKYIVAKYNEIHVDYADQFFT